MNLRRKRMMLMDGQWYGYLRTASGNPLTLQNAKRLRKLTIYGNAVQDGTPSPDAPVEVQLCGDRTGNLFDKSHASNIDNWELSTQKDSGFYELQGITDGATITIALKLNSTLSTSSGISVYTYNGVYKAGFNSQTTELQTRTITYADGDRLRIYVPSTNGAVNNYMKLVDADLQIIQGSYTADTLPAYEAYGYKVSGRAEGVNLFTSDESKWQIQTYKYFKIPVDGTTTLQMKLKSGKSIPSGLYVGYTKTGYPSDTGINWLIENGVYLNSGVDIKTSSASYISMYPQYLFDEMLDAFDIMLVQGAYTSATIPPYEPYQPPQDFAVYLPEQIAKVGDTADEVVVDMEKRTAELRKNVGSVVADGEESWLRGTANYDKAEYTNRYAIFSAIKGDWRTPGPLCDKFEREFGNTWDSTNYECFNVNIQQLHLNISNTRLGITADDESADRTTKFKAWLNDNNVTVYAPLATPVTTDITSLQQWDAMPQVSGTVTLTLSAEVEPSGAEAVYYSKERGE